MANEVREPSFELLPSVDVTRLPLTPEEGFVVSRFAGRRRTIADLARETGLPPPEIKRHLEGLVRKGAVSMAVQARADGEVTDQRIRLPYDGMIFSPADLADGVDLTDEQKKRILHVDGNLTLWNHYKLLGVRRTASAADIKAAYFKVSREFHPDSFFRKNIGRFGERIERIFRAMKLAYDELANPERRIAYDEKLVGGFTAEEMAELEAIAAQKRAEAERAERLARNDADRKAARMKWNPMSARISRGGELMKLAEDALKAGRLDEALNQSRLAVSFEAALGPRAEAIAVEVETARAQQLIKRLQFGVQSVSTDNEADLLKAAETLLETVEKLRRPRLLLDLAGVLQALKRPARVFRLASLATEVDPKLVAGWQLMAEAAAQESKWALAVRAADRWLALEPSAARPKEIKDLARK